MVCLNLAVRRALIAVFAVALLALLPVPAHATSADVTVQNFSFQPATVTINQGESVTWTNKQTGTPHTATSDDGSTFDTSPTCGPAATEDESCLKPDAPVTVTFNGAGTFPYHCKIHSSMHGTVIVLASSTTSTATTEPATTSTTEAATTQPQSSSSSTNSSSSASTSTSSTTTTSSSTTTTSSTSTTTTTTLLSSGSGQVGISDKGGGSGGSSALPILLGGAALVAALAALAYWLWWRSGEPIDEGPDWTQEPPPTTQGPRI